VAAQEIPFEVALQQFRTLERREVELALQQTDEQVRVGVLVSGLLASLVQLRQGEQPQLERTLTQFGGVWLGHE